ncbi:MAG: hypothetical protein LBS70_06905 [Candidatus Accumulibacter sp.]|nr:hypothetical protein [Accumulibacter sp.]
MYHEKQHGDENQGNAPVPLGSKRVAQREFHFFVLIGRWGAKRRGGCSADFIPFSKAPRFCRLCLAALPALSLVCLCGANNPEME